MRLAHRSPVSYQEKLSLAIRININPENAHKIPIPMPRAVPFINPQIVIGINMIRVKFREREKLGPRELVAPAASPQ